MAVITLVIEPFILRRKRRRGTHDIRNQENGVCLDEVADEVAETPFRSVRLNFSLAFFSHND